MYGGTSALSFIFHILLLHINYIFPYACILVPFIHFFVSSFFLGIGKKAWQNEHHVGGKLALGEK